MMEIQPRVQEVSMLWMNPEPDNLQRIVELCIEIEGMHAAGELAGQVDRGLLLRAARLAANALQRAVECLATQAQTGNYSLLGAPERMRRLSTAVWEG